MPPKHAQWAGHYQWIPCYAENCSKQTGGPICPQCWNLLYSDQRNLIKKTFNDNCSNRVYDPSKHGLISDAEQHGILATRKCLACLEDLPASGEGEGESVTALPCMHAFHSECIQQWATTQGCAVEGVRCPARCKVDERVASAIELVLSAPTASALT